MKVNKIRVIVVEDNPEYREVIRLAFEDQSDIELVHQFVTAEIALRTLREESSPPTHDLILLDLRLPGMDGLSALAHFRECVPETKVMVLSQSNREQDVLRAISLGASGYLLKSATLNEITDGIRTVAKGGASLDKNVAIYLLNSLQSKDLQAEDDKLLTDREFEIIALLAEGLVKKEIATELGISYSTVDTHVAHIYQKLRVSNAPSAVNKAHQLGFFRGRR